jgi:hypothetical protein
MEHGKTNRFCYFFANHLFSSPDNLLSRVLFSPVWWRGFCMSGSGAMFGEERFEKTRPIGKRGMVRFEKNLIHYGRMIFGGFFLKGTA